MDINNLFIDDVYQGIILAVIIENKDENIKSIDHLKVGDVFGENSLLTGEPRNATIIPIVDSIVYEIDKQIIEPYFHRYPVFLEHIESLLTERKLHNMQMMTLFNEEKTNEIKASILIDVKQKIRRFFNLKNDLPA
ncbi:MAG: cyclic nucleotide-binding domain-containing protein [Methylococcales bacterium]|nr:cyclic nucleotide-binding domain-containing protein [Methylococcales bacterium]